MTATAFDALVGNRGLGESLIGFEPITRAMRLIMSEYLNDEIDRQSGAWSTADLELQELGFDPGVGQVDVQHVPIENIHEGPHWSLLKAPPERFPAVVVMAPYAQPMTNGGFGDQFDSSNVVLAIESFAIAGPVAADMDVPFETIVHRRIQRMTEAVNAVMRRNKTLLGSVAPIQSPPIGGIGKQSWVKMADGRDRYIWQGSRLEYTSQRVSIF